MNVGLNRRSFLTVSALAAASTLVPRAARAQATVKVGTAVLGDYALAGPIITSVERGYFKQENVTAEFVPFRGGPDLLKAVLAGEIVVAMSGATDIFVFREAGAAIKAIATHIEGNHFTLNVAPDIQKIADLKGKAIGVTLPGSNTWAFARMLARQQGWDPDHDVKIVPLGGLDAQVAALTRKETAAFIFGDSGAVTEVQGKSKILARLDSVLTPKWISLIQYASEEQIRKNADAIRKVQRAVFHAMKFMKEKPEETAPPIARRLNWSVEAVLRAHKISAPLFPVDGTMSIDALGTMQDTLLEYGMLKKKLPLEEHYTKEFTPVKV